MLVDEALVGASEVLKGLPALNLQISHHGFGPNYLLAPYQASRFHHFVEICDKVGRCRQFGLLNTKQKKFRSSTIASSQGIMLGRAGQQPASEVRLIPDNFIFSLSRFVSGDTREVCYLYVYFLMRAGRAICIMSHMSQQSFFHRQQASAPCLTW